MRPQQFPANMSFILTQLLTKYDKVMVLKLFVDADDNELTNKYYNAAFAHNTKVQQSVNRIDTHIDAGFDLFAPVQLIIHHQVHPIPCFQTKRIN